MRAGDTIGRFTIEALIGDGGMGAVYRAHDSRLDRRVALKVLHVDAADGDAIEAMARLLREARSAAALDHPNAVAIFDVGDASGVAYIAMELVDGVPLRRLIGRTDIPVEQRLQWLVDVARALAAAHDRGLVHRDVKPENVMVRTDGGIKVLDFGIARRLHTGRESIEDPLPSDPVLMKRALSTLTTDGRVMGTPLYMAPEQVRGAALDARADQFSWGVVAYELLSGTLPWEEGEEAVVTVERMLTTDPKPLHSHGLALPAVVEAVVEKAMARKPADRFESMRQLIEALQPFARASLRPMDLTAAPSGGARADAPTEMSGQVTQPVRAKRRTRFVVGVAAAVLAAGIGAGAALFVWSRAGQEPAGASSASSGAPGPEATIVSDLPVPASTSAEARAAYRSALDAMRAGHGEVSAREFQHAATLDPTMGPAFLRLAMLSFWMGHYKEGRETFATANQLRATMNEHDRALLDATSPWIERWPPDVDEVTRRFGVLAQRWPRDAELHLYWMHLLSDLGDEAGAVRAARELQALDPPCTNAYQAAFWAYEFLDDPAGAAQTAADCERGMPGDPACLGLRARSMQYAGDCAGLEAPARELTVRDPTNALGFALLAESFAALGRPREAVLEALRQRWSRGMLWAKPGELADRARLEMLFGNFVDAEARLDEYDAAIAAEPNEPAHAVGALMRLDLREETGRTAEAGRFARDYLSRAEGWTRDPGVDGTAIEADPLPRMLAAEVRAGLIPRTELVRRRDEWAAAWSARTRPLFARYLWFSGWAGVARAPEELADAAEAQPRFAPLPKFHEGALDAQEEGLVDLSSGRLEDAIATLGRAAASCTVLTNPIRHVRALEELGEARELSGDTTAACDAYARTLAAWGKATPRAVTAERARARAKALRCPAR
jgi:tRNA A-37 threonylcarbamoyl transferase component Bud32/tetratricopeptide (TPR) repeat protein